MSFDWIPTESTRKITAKERGNRGIIPSSKVEGGYAEYESCLERDELINVHHAPSVKKFLHQPKTIFYKDKKGRTRKYTPDVYVEYNNGKRYIYEIKYRMEVIESFKKYEERWLAAKKWAKQNGLIFRVLTEKEIRTPRLENIWFTLGASKCTNNDKYLSRLKKLIPREGIDYNSLCLVLSEALGMEIGKAAQIVCYAIYHGFVFVDTFSTKLISCDTIIRVRKSKDISPFRPLWEILESDTFINLDILNEDETDSKVQIISLESEPSSEHEEEVYRREKIVIEWLKQPSKKRTIEWREEFCKKCNTSESTIYRWVDHYRKGGGKEALIPYHKKKGRKKSYDQMTLDLIEKARKYYFKSTNITLKKAHRKLGELCKKKNKAIPPKSTFEYYIYSDSTQSEFGKKHGKKYYKSNYTPSLSSFQGGILPMQIIQMDNTDFDVFPVDSEERDSIRPPYMTAGIDCYTGMITGFSLSLFPSSSQTVLDVLVQSILPKDNYTKVYDTESTWSIQGFPVVILVDNGMDYRSNALQDFCKKYDIIIEYVPIRTPRYKALIEQWFKILREALKDEDVPGYRPLLKYRLENPDLKPELDSFLTLQDAEVWLHKWVVDGYHLTNQYDDHISAPYVRLYNAQNGISTKLILPYPREPPTQQSNIDTLHLSTLDSFNRTLTSGGIIWQYLRFNNLELADLFLVIGKKQVKVLQDRRDIRSLWVINPITHKPIKIGLAYGWAQAVLKGHNKYPIIRSIWIKETQLIKTRIKGKLTPHKYKREISRIKRQKLLAKAKRETKQIRKEKEKVKESMRKNINQKLQSSNNFEELPKTNENKKDKNKINAQPKQEIDWSQISPVRKRKKRAF